MKENDSKRCFEGEFEVANAFTFMLTKERKFKAYLYIVPVLTSIVGVKELEPSLKGDSV